MCYLLPQALTKVAARLSKLGHNGRFFTLRWELPYCGEHGLVECSKRPLLPADKGDSSWVAYEYSRADVSAVTPLRPADTVDAAAPSTPWDDAAAAAQARARLVFQFSR